MGNYHEVDASCFRISYLKENYKTFKEKWVCIFNDNIILEEKYKNGKLEKCLYYDEVTGNSAAIKMNEVQINSWIFMPVSLTRTEQINFAKGYQKKYKSAN